MCKVESCFHRRAVKPLPRRRVPLPTVSIFPSHDDDPKLARLQLAGETRTESSESPHIPCKSANPNHRPGQAKLHTDVARFVNVLLCRPPGQARQQGTPPGTAVWWSALRKRRRAAVHLRRRRRVAARSSRWEMPIQYLQV